MIKTAYTRPETIERDAEGWLAAIGLYLRHPGPGPMHRPALLVIDMQRWFLEPGAPAFLPAARAIEGGVGSLVGAFHSRGFPVAFTVHRDGAGPAGAAMQEWWGRHVQETWAEPAYPEWIGPDDRMVVKRSYSAFVGTGLAEFLNARDVHTLVLAGVQTHICVESTARDAFSLGFMPVVVADATAAADLDLHLGSLRAVGHSCARVAMAREVVGGDRRGVRVHDQDHESVEVLVVGAGPAGMAAAIQAHRQGLRTLLIDGAGLGGLVATADLVENYPGFPGGITGADLAARMVAQTLGLGVRFGRGRVEAISVSTATEVRSGTGTGTGGRRFVCTLEGGGKVEARAVILATGTAPRAAGIEGEAAFAGTRVFYRADQALTSGAGKSWCVIGGGDCAIDGAAHLRRHGREVTVLVRGERPAALPLLVRRAADMGVEVVTRGRALALREEGGRVKVEAERGGRAFTMTVDGVLVAVGREQSLPRFPDPSWPGECDGLGRTAVPGLYLAGDCRRGWVRQTSVAAGDGVAAAMDVRRYLDGNA